MNSEQLKHFSEELKEARKASDLTLQVLYQRTRIDLKFLEAIENGNFEIIDEVYLRAFIKSYAKTVGLDPEETIQKFDKAKSGHLFDKPAEEEIEENSESDEPERKKVVFTSENVAPPYYENNQKKKADPRIFIFGVILIVIVVLVYIFAFGESPDNIIVESVNPQTSEPVKEVPVERFELMIDDSVETPEPVASFKDSIILKISATSRVWIRLIADENNQSEFTLDQNESKTVKAESIFNLLIGNAGGINLELNGSPLNLVGKVGEIKNIKVDSSGIQYLRINQNQVDGSN